MSRLEDYQNAFEATHCDFGHAFHLVADDPENLVVILTGTGDRFCGHFDFDSFNDLWAAGAHEFWLRIRRR